MLHPALAPCQKDAKDFASGRESTLAIWILLLIQVANRILLRRVRTLEYGAPHVDSGEQPGCLVPGLRLGRLSCGRAEEGRLVASPAASLWPSAERWGLRPFDGRDGTELGK